MPLKSPIVAAMTPAGFHHKQNTRGARVGADVSLPRGVIYNNLVNHATQQVSASLQKHSPSNAAEKNPFPTWTPVVSHKHGVCLKG